jgi:hypothetical protein
MDPMTLLALGSAGANILGGIAGQQAAAGDRSAATGILKDLYAQYGALTLPDIEKMRLALEQYGSAGSLSPDAEAAEQLAMIDALQNVSLDPQLRQTQMDQLNALQQIAQSGFTPEEAAQMTRLKNQVAADQQARMQQMQQQQDVRGVGSSDAALAARIMASQQATNTEAQAAQDMAALAFRRALEARAQAAQQASGMENTDYARQAALAQNLNQRELMNLQQRAGTQQRNIDRFNEAQKYNLGNLQSIANMNTQLANQQQQYNKQLYQQDFQNQLARLQGMSGAGTNAAGALSNQAAQTAQSFANIGGAVGQGLLGFGMMQNEKKENPLD